MGLLAFVVACFGAIATLGVALWAMDISVGFDAIGILIWALSPYLLLLPVTRLVKKPRAKFLALLLSAIVVGGGVWSVVGAFFINPDPQSGLVFLFLPLWQWVAVLALIIPIYFLDRNPS